MGNGDARLAAQTIDFADLPPVGEPGEITLRAPHALGEVERIEFGNGVKALLLANGNEPGRVAVKVRFGAGIRAFAPEDAALVQLGEGALIQSGLGELDQEDLDRLATGRKLGFEFGIGEGAFTFTAQTRRQDLADQLYLFAAKLGMPRWDAAPLARAKAAGRLAYQSYASNPAGVVNRDLEYYLYGQDRRFLTPTPDMLEAVTLDQFRSFWGEAMAQGPVEILIFGDYDKEEAVEALRRTFGALPDREPIPAEVAERGVGFATPGETLVRFHQGEADQAAAVMAWPVGAGPGEIRKSRQLSILTEVFNNRLRDAMRERAGASYAPNVRLDWPADVETGGTITALAQLRPGDVPTFFRETDRIARELTTTPPTEAELAEATEPLRNFYERISSGNYFFLLELENSTLDPRRMQALRGLLNDYSQTSPEVMLALAQEYFGGTSGWRMAVIPEGQDLATGPSAPVVTGR